MSHIQLKQKAKSLFTGHYGFFFIMFSPYWILSFIGNSINYRFNLHHFPGIYNHNLDLSRGDNIGSLFIFLAYLLMVGISFVCIDSFRNKADFQKPFLKAFSLFTNAKYFWGAIWIGLLKIIWTFLWSLLLIVPGIIKSIAYSQAVFIYRDAIDKNQPLGYIQAVTESRRLMVGHKWNYFWLNLTFIGWWILSALTLGLVGLFWVTPYYHLALANFYHRLKD